MKFICYAWLLRFFFYQPLFCKSMISLSSCLSTSIWKLLDIFLLKIYYAVEYLPVLSDLLSFFQKLKSSTHCWKIILLQDHFPAELELLFFVGLCFSKVFSIFVAVTLLLVTTFAVLLLLILPLFLSGISWCSCLHALLQVGDNYYRPDLKKAALARLSAVNRSLKVFKSGVKKRNRQAHKARKWNW